MDLHKKLLILIIVFTFLVRILFVFYSPLRGWDETVYLNLGRQLSEQPLNYSLQNSGWNDFIPADDPVYAWPNIGFRAPLLPYTLSIFYFFNLDFLIPFLLPFFAALSAFLVYILGKELFNRRAGLYAAFLFSLLPVHIFASGQIWTDTFVVFFLLLSFISFWRCFERRDNKYKMLFGLFLALALLARYTTLWLGPVFLFYLLLKEKSFKFLKDKYLWYGAGVFLLTLLPWLLYGFVYYDNPLGAFVHVFQASAYWGGVQPWTFFLQSAWLNFSVIASLFLLALFYVSFKKRWLRREIILLLAWVIFFFLVVSFMPHKENRFILPIVPSVCLLVGFLLSELKRFGNLILGFVGAILLISVAGVAATYENKANDQATTCFWEANKFLANQEHNSLILTNQSPISYYYTRKENKLYPDPWKFDSLREELDKNYIGREVYFLYSNYDMPQESKIQDDLDDNLTKAFKCTKDRGYAAVYHL